MARQVAAERVGARRGIPWTRRRYFGAAMGSLTAGALAACAPGATSEGPGAAGGGTAKPQTLVLNHRTGQPQSEVFKNHFNPRFQERYPHITVEYNVIPSGEWQEKFIASYMSGTPGDLIWSNQADQMHLFSAAGMHKPLDDLVKADKYDLGGFYPRAIADNRWEGKLYGLPWQSHAGLSGLYVNADLAQQRSLALPRAGERWTFEQFEEAARKLTTDPTQPDSHWGTFVDQPSQLYQNVAYSYGAGLLSPDGTKPALDDPRLTAALEWMAALIHTRRVAPKPQERSGNHYANFAQKKVGMFMAGAWDIPNTDRAVQGAFRWIVLPVPAGPAGAVTGAAANDNWSIPAIAKSPEAAWTYAKWYCEPPQLIDWLRLWGGNPTARPAVNETHYVTGEYGEYRKPHLAQLQSARYATSPTPKNQRQRELESKLVMPKLVEIWRGEKAVRAALQELAAPLAALVAEPLQVTS